MKLNLKYSLFLIPALLLSVSCTNLDETVYSQIKADAYTPTEDDLFSNIGPAYTTLRAWIFGWHGNYDLQEECSDEIVTPVRPNGWNDGGVYKDMHYHSWTSELGHVAASYGNIMDGVTYCNKSIYQIEDGELPISDADLKSSVLAELKVLRAFYYYQLCDNYGNVPIVDKYDVPSDYLPTQSTRLEVYNYVISSIEENIDLLSETNGGIYYGRINKWTAYCILAKMYLNAEVYTGTSQWDKCIEVCNKVINSGLYSLESDFSKPFIVENESSPEIIFAIPFKTSGLYDGKFGWFHLVWKTLHPQNQLTYNFTYVPWCGNCGIPQFIDTYKSTDKRLAKSWIMGQQYSSTGDSLYCTLDAKLAKANTPLSFDNYVPTVKTTTEYNGYRIGKFEIEKGINWGGLSNDWPMFRYADVLMMKAECLLRNGSADEAAAIVTEVRTRDFDNYADAVVTGDELTQGSCYRYGFYEKAKFSKGEEGGADIQYGRFFDELGWEFVSEAHRRQDMIRFGVFTKKSWLSHVPNGDYRTIFPIPYSVLSANSNLTQNPGY